MLLRKTHTEPGFTEVLEPSWANSSHKCYQCPPQRRHNNSVNRHREICLRAFHSRANKSSGTIGPCPVPTVGKALLSCSSERVPKTFKTIWTVAVPIDDSPELDGKTFLLKGPHILIKKHGEINLVFK